VQSASSAGPIAIVFAQASFRVRRQGRILPSVQPAPSLTDANSQTHPSAGSWVNSRFGQIYNCTQLSGNRRDPKVLRHRATGPLRFQKVLERPVHRRWSIASTRAGKPVPEPGGATQPLRGQIHRNHKAPARDSRLQRSARSAPAPRLAFADPSEGPTCTTRVANPLLPQSHGFRPAPPSNDPQPVDRAEAHSNPLPLRYRAWIYPAALSVEQSGQTGPQILLPASLPHRAAKKHSRRLKTWRCVSQGVSSLYQHL